MPFHCPSCQRRLSESDDASDRPMFCTFCGFRMRNPPAAAKGIAVEDAVPLTVATPVAARRFQTIRHIGSGGMGDVYEAVDSATGERVAMKFLAKHFAANPAAVEQFRSLGNLAGTISHPRCVRVISVGDDAERPFIAMELMLGNTLKDISDASGPMPPERAIPYVLDAIDGLSAAHRLGIVHCDIKPSNCLLTEADRVKIGDFGLCRIYGADQPALTPARRRGFSGTLLFSAPEQIRGEEVGFDSDIYSVCATLYYLVGGRAPHQAESLTAALAKAISEPPPPLRAVAPNVSAKLERIILKGLDRERNKRWSSLDELRTALESELVGKGWLSRLRGLMSRR